MRTLVAFLVILASIAVVFLGGLRLAAMIREVGVLPQRPPAEGRMVETALGELYVEERGPGTGPPVLMVHGAVGWAALWRPTAQALADAGYRAIAFDMPPMGWSARDTKRDYSRQMQAQRILALVEALGIRPVLVAHSFGAGAAAEAAIKRPDAFAGLVVVSGTVGLGSDGTGQTPPWPLDNPFMRELAVSATLTNPSATGPMLRRFLYRKEAATPEVLAGLNGPGRRSGSTAAIADWLPTLLVPPAGAASTAAAAWQALPLPLAFVWGDRNTASAMKEGETLAELTGAPLFILADVGHIPQLEAPAEFQATLLAILADMTPEDP